MWVHSVRRSLPFFCSEENKIDDVAHRLFTVFYWSLNIERSIDRLRLRSFFRSSINDEFPNENEKNSGQRDQTRSIVFDMDHRSNVFNFEKFQFDVRKRTWDKLCRSIVVELDLE